MLPALQRKLLRDLARLGGQVVTIALVIAAGIASFVTMRGNYLSLDVARLRFYDQQRFGDVFAQLERAPLAIAHDLAALPGVAQVETRIVKSVALPLAQLPEPVRGIAVSLSSTPLLNLPRLHEGRLMIPDRSDEVVLLQGFAAAHHIRPGDRLPAIINGRQRSLAVVGLASSPEYVMAVAPGSLSPDPARFAVLWLGHAAMTAAFEMQGACNEVSLTLRPGASIASTIAAMDRLLQPYGGLGAHDRSKQVSNRVIETELMQLSNNAILLPLIFLAVATLLVNLVLSRLVHLQQAEIATLKALGYANRQVGLHFVELVLVISALGALLGILLGHWLGRAMLTLYARFFHFPNLAFHFDAQDAAFAAAISFLAALLGGYASVRQATRLPPAEAMRPPSPTQYRPSILDRLGLRRFFSPAAHMVLRELQRRPLRTVASCVALAAATALNVLDGYYYDGVEALAYSQFHEHMREDVAVAFSKPLPRRVLHELAHIPGVRQVEGLRIVSVRIHAGHRHRDLQIWGHRPEDELRQPRDSKGRVVPLPKAGIVLTDILASVLQLRVGDEIEVELREGRRDRLRLVISGFVSESFGLHGHMQADALQNFLRAEPQVSLALLRIDRRQSALVDQRLKELPHVLDVTKVENILRQWQQQSGSMILTMAFIIALFAGTITIGVVYNNARVALSMRSRDLASLRVLGFSRGEISAILIGEQLVQVFLALPFGLFLGQRLVQLLASMVDPESYRIPMTLTLRSYAFGVLVTLVAALLSVLLVRRRLDRLDLIGVLKTRD